MTTTIEQQILLCLLKESFGAADASLAEDLLREADWSAVLREACAQSVPLQAFDAVGKYRSRIPAEVYQRWFSIATKRMQNNMRIQMAQNELTALLDRHGLSYVILKGTCSASYYPRPELRAMGDIDFLIDLQQEQEVRKTLDAAGYKTNGKETYQHAVYVRGGIPYEMHFRVTSIPEGEIGQVLLDYFKDIRLRAEQQTMDLARFTAPCAAHHGMIILLHMINHMLGMGLGLRHLCDWAAFVNATADAPFWQEELLPLMKRCGIFRYASVVTKICADHLGIVFPDWCEPIEAEQAEEILQDIFSSGNFGRKELDRSRESCIVSMEKSGEEDVGPVRNALRVLHRTTPNQHPIVKRIPILHPVFDFFRGVRYLFRCIRGDRRWLGEMLPKARERQSIYEQLKVFKTEPHEGAHN